MKTLSVILFTTIYFLLSCHTCIARTVPHWDLPKLFSESDLVLIVEAGETRMAKVGDVVAPLNKSDSEILVPVITTLKVEVVLKGEYTQATFELPHHEMKRIKGAIGNGPNLIKFERHLKEVRGKGFSTEFDLRYMVFLKKDDKDRYFPVTGSYDPIYSVRQVIEPLPPDKGVVFFNSEDSSNK